MKRFLLTEIIDGKAVGTPQVITKGALQGFWEYVYLIFIFGLGFVFGMMVWG